ncbi:MAG TPA: Ig-like domain-containing protein, partial [Pirellulaceae bacterium]|nr:Ig-like domain-containing protein [Pirellulaceae bacterium]
LAGWTVFADVNSNGVADSGEPQATSASDGSYRLTSLTPGTVSIVEVVSTSWRATAPSSHVHVLSLKSGDTLAGIDFGNAELKDSTIRGVVYVDSDKNGSRGTGERGLAGITVYLDLDNSGTLDPSEPSLVTSSDLFYTPDVDEAGTYAFTHLAKGSYVVRTVVPELLSATPAAQREHQITIVAAEDRAGVDTGAVYRPSEIHGVRFDDVDGDHVRDAGEPGVAGATVFVDLDRDDTLDLGEPTTTTAADGSYAFTDLAPGAYVVREIAAAGYEHTYPLTTGGTLWPSGVSHPAVGTVSPGEITASLASGQSLRQTVSITLPGTGALTNLVDVFLLFDDTGSFTYNSPIVRSAFPDIIAQLQTSLPGIDLGFGVGRFEEYGNFAWEYDSGRPFILNQPIVAASTSGYMTAIQAALDRTTPGYGGDQPETDIEALYQVVTGAGFDGNNNGSVLDSGRAGLAATQLNPGASGDVPSFASFVADPTNSVLPAAGTVGGVGFRAGALPIILTATDTGFAYEPKGESVVTGVGGLTLPISKFTETSRPTTPNGAGAGIQQTVTALNALGALVIGLGTNPEATLDPRQGLEALSTLTGAVNRSTATIDNGTVDPIAPGDPFYFQIASGFGASVANGVVNAIQNAVTNVAVNVTVQASDPRVRIINHSGVATSVGAGQTASFDVEFIGDGVPHRFDLQFVRAGTNVILGSIPVVLGTPVPGDGYEFEDLEDGEVSSGLDFGARLATSSGNTAPVAVADAYSTNEDTTLVVDVAHGVLASDSDVDGDALTAVLVSGTAHGSLSLAADGSFSYSPAANFAGTDSFSYKANDGAADSNVVVVTLTVAPVNDAPVAAADAYSTNEDTTLVVDVAHGVLASDSDVDGDALTAVLVSGTAHGSLSLAADGSFSYSPAANFAGTDSFSYKANDGAADSNVVVVTLTVAPVNDAPVAAADAYSTNEDTTLVVDVAH